MTNKRIFDLIVASAALVVLAPLMVAVAFWVKIDSSGGIIFRQERIGRNCVPFNIFKFRTMISHREDGGLLITTASDARVTRCGRLLRKLKIDELPQLVNVVLGQMSMVGPRPEVGRYVDLYPESVRDKVLSVRPGITDSAAILYRDEAKILERADDAEREYLETILPRKLSMYESYIDAQSLGGDVILIARTLRAVTFRSVDDS